MRCRLLLGGVGADAVMDLKQGLLHVSCELVCSASADAPPSQCPLQANLLFTPDWKLKVCDYGVSICLGEEVRELPAFRSQVVPAYTCQLSQQGLIAPPSAFAAVIPGTPQRAVTRTGSRDYMAPEVNVCPLKRTPADNKENPQMAYGAAVDVWSVGALAYELLVGFTPFPGGPPATRKGDPTKSLVFPSSVSNDARNFVLSCLEQAPGDRPTVQQLLRHRWLQGASGGADRSTVGTGWEQCG